MSDQETLWGALMRRKVVKAVTLYLAGAWLAIQVASLIAGIWSLPAGFVQNLFVLLLIGLPLVAVMSWVYDLRDDELVATAGASFGNLLRRKLRQHPLRAALATIGLIVVGLVGIAYAWPDEPLSPEAQALIRAYSASRDDDAQNLTYGLFGWNAATPSDIWDHGRLVVDRHRVLGDDPSAGYEPIFTVGTKDLCVLFQDGCLAKLQATIAGTRTLIAANAAPLARHRELMTARTFSDVGNFSFSGPVPTWEPLMVGERLEMMQALYEDSRGEHASALARVDESLAFHRRMLARSDTLIMKMVAIALIQNDVRFAALLTERAAHRPGRVGFPAQPPSRLTDADRSLIAVLAHEVSAGIATAVGPGMSKDALFETWTGNKSPHPVDYLPFRRNATMNKWLARDVETVRTMLMPAKDFAALPTPPPYVPNWFDIYTNAAGERLLALSWPWHDYIQRTHDLDALIVLAQAAHALHASGVTAAELPSALLALPEHLRDPFTGKPPVWKDGKLRFVRSEERDLRNLFADIPFEPG